MKIDLIKLLVSLQIIIAFSCGDNNPNKTVKSKDDSNNSSLDTSGNISKNSKKQDLELNEDIKIGKDDSKTIDSAKQISKYQQLKDGFNIEYHCTDCHKSNCLLKNKTFYIQKKFRSKNNNNIFDAACDELLENKCPICDTYLKPRHFTKYILKNCYFNYNGRTNYGEYIKDKGKINGIKSFNKKFVFDCLTLNINIKPLSQQSK